jgi:hypothetical protein
MCPRCGQILVQATPPPPQRPTLILKLEAPQLPPREWEITDEPAGIGRLDDSDITVPDKSVSRQHARILPTTGGFDVEDLGSTNGTWLNDKQITDRRPLSNGDQLMIGDIPLRVTLRGAAAVVPQVAPVLETRVQQAQVQPQPHPQPLPSPINQPPPGSSLRPGGPSTVFYDIDEALAAVQPQGSSAQPVLPTSGPPVQPATRPQESADVSTAWDVTPATGSEVTPPPRTAPVIIDTRPAPPAGGPYVEQPTLIAAEPVTAPDPSYAPRPTPSYDPRPGPANEPRPTSRESLADATLWPQPATYDPQAGPALEPRPTPSYDPQPGPALEPRPTPSYDPQPGPALEPRPTPSYDPQPGPALEPRPTPSYDPQPGPVFVEQRARPGYDPQPGPAFSEQRPQTGTAFEQRPAPTRPDVVYEPRPRISPPPSTPQPAGPSEDLSTVNLIELADRLGTALRVFKGDTRLALWLFEHAGGRAAAQSFVEQAERAERNPDNPIEQARLLDLAPTAARLLEAATMLANVVSSFQTPDDEAEANAPDLQPIPRP